MDKLMNQRWDLGWKEYFQWAMRHKQIAIIDDDKEDWCIWLQRDSDGILKWVYTSYW